MASVTGQVCDAVSPVNLTVGHINGINGQSRSIIWETSTATMFISFSSLLLLLPAQGQHNQMQLLPS